MPMCSGHASVQQRGDVAQAGTALVFDFLNAVVGVEGVHVKAGQAHHESGTGEVLLCLAVTQDVAGVLTEEAFDALAELLHSIDILLHHAVLAVGVTLAWGEGSNAFVLFVIPRHVTGQVADHREGFHRLKCDGFSFFEGVHTRHARERGLAVDLHAA